MTFVHIASVLVGVGVGVGVGGAGVGVFTFVTRLFGIGRRMTTSCACATPHVTTVIISTVRIALIPVMSSTSLCVTR